MPPAGLRPLTAPWRAGRAGAGDGWEEPEPPGPCAPARDDPDARRRPARHRRHGPAAARARSHDRRAPEPAARVRSVETPAPAPGRTAPEPARPATTAGLNSARPGPPTAPAQRMANPRFCARQLSLSRARSQQAQLRTAAGPCLKSEVKAPWQCDCKSKLCSLIRDLRCKSILQVGTTRAGRISGHHYQLMHPCRHKIRATPTHTAATTHCPAHSFLCRLRRCTAGYVLERRSLNTRREPGPCCALPHPSSRPRWSERRDLGSAVGTSAGRRR